MYFCSNPAISCYTFVHTRRCADWGSRRLREAWKDSWSLQASMGGRQHASAHISAEQLWYTQVQRPTFLHWSGNNTTLWPCSYFFHGRELVSRLLQFTVSVSACLLSDFFLCLSRSYVSNVALVSVCASVLFSFGTLPFHPIRYGHYIFVYLILCNRLYQLATWTLRATQVCNYCISALS